MIGIKLPVGGMYVMMLKEYTLHTCGHLQKRRTLGNCCVLNSYFVYLLYICSSRHHTTSGKIVNLHIYGEETRILGDCCYILYSFSMES